MPRIGVITAIGPGDSDYLPGLVDSLRGQAMADWQLILAEDGPTRSAAQWAETDPRIDWINSATRNGPAATRNLASTRLRSAVWRNLDADDWLADDGVLERTLDVFARVDITYCVGPVVDVAEDGRRTTFHSSIPHGLVAPGLLYGAWLAGGQLGAVHPTSLALRTDVFRRYGGYPALPSSEDTALLLRVSQHERGWFLDRPVTLHRVRAGSVTASDGHTDAAGTARRHAFVRSVCGAGHLD